MPDRISTLPAQSTRLVGRDDTVRILSVQVMTHRLVSIVGPGGVGKTTVAVSVAHALADRFESEVFFVDLGSVTDPLLVPVAVTSDLRLEVQTRDPLGGLLAWIHHRKILIVLDNCEHVIEAAAALLKRIVATAARAHILVTTREALRVENEVVHPLHNFDCPPENASLTAAKVLAYPSAQLFMMHATASGYDSKLNDADAVIVARICRSLDGIALAIELAASRAISLGIRGIADLLANRFRLLWQDNRTALPRHRTLSAMLDWSYNLLSEHEKATFRRLSVFVGDFTLQAAYDVAFEEGLRAPDTAVTVSNLVAKSLILTADIGGSSYYRLLSTTRAYAADKLAQSGELEKTAPRHAVSCCRLPKENTSIEASFSQRDSLRCAVHLDKVRAALAWSMSDCGDAAAGIDLAADAAPSFLALSMHEEYQGCCKRALKVLGETHRRGKREVSLHETMVLTLMCVPVACYHFWGNQAEAQLHFKTAAINVAELGGLNAEYRVFYRYTDGLAAFARALQLRSFSDRARKVMQKVIKREGPRDHSVCLCFALAFGLPIYLWIDDFAESECLVDQLVACAVQYLLDLYRTLGMALKGELAIRSDKREICLDLLLFALKALHVGRENDLTTVFAGVHAEGLRKIGQVHEALTAIDRAIANSGCHGGSFTESPEMKRSDSVVLPLEGSWSFIRYVVSWRWHVRSAFPARQGSAVSLSQRLAERYGSWNTNWAATSFIAKGVSPIFPILESWCCL